MSVAILPLSTSNGWPPSVAGIVQVRAWAERERGGKGRGRGRGIITTEALLAPLLLLSASNGWPPSVAGIVQVRGGGDRKREAGEDGPSQSSFLKGYLITPIAVSSSPTHLPLLSPSSPPRSLPLLPSQSSFLWGYLITPIMPNSRFTPPRPPMPSPPPSPPFPSPPSQSSFLWGYLITPIIGGSLADRYGGRPVLAAGLALWSLATLLTPSAAAHSLGALLTVRAVMGLGEGVALPCMNHMVSREEESMGYRYLLRRLPCGQHAGAAVSALAHGPSTPSTPSTPMSPFHHNPCTPYVPENRRAWAVGICFAGFHVGSMLGLLSAPSLMALPGLGLTGPFLIFGALGLLWLALWLLLVPADAAAAPSASAASCAHSFESTQKVPGDAPAAPSASAASGAVSGGQLDGKQRMQSGSRVTVWQLLSHPASWAIIIANTVNNWGYFILLSWMPLYFNQVLHTDIRQAAWFSVGPWAVMAGMGLLAAQMAGSLSSHTLPLTVTPPHIRSHSALTPPGAAHGHQAGSVVQCGAMGGHGGDGAARSRGGEPHGGQTGHDPHRRAQSHAAASLLLLLTRMATGPLAALCLTAALFSESLICHHALFRTAGFLGPAASLLLLTRMTSAPLAALCLTAALGLSAFSQAGWLLNHKDIAPRHVGLLHGLSNTAGTLAGITSTVATGFMVEQLGSFHAVLAVTAALYVLATAFWLAYATADVVFP
ncbi:unnamed protein product [Closterium sp. NIES-64]|nr:unnamed protein product [Closterium sp. NIES-64]